MTIRNPTVNVNASVAATADDTLAAGEYVPRQRRTWSTTSGVLSQSVYFTYFTADKTETISTCTMFVGLTAAGATPTICRMAVWSVDGAGNLTQVAVTPNDTALFAAAGTAYPKAFSASFGKVQGQRYATSVLVVSAFATPTFLGNLYTNAAASYNVLSDQPSVCTKLAGQADMPAGPITVGSLAGTQFLVAAKLT